MDQYFLNPQKLDANKDMASDHEKRFSKSEASHSILMDFSTNYQVQNHFTCNQVKQTTKPSGAEVNGDIKMKEVRRKGRPPKLEKQTVDGFCCNICKKVFSNSSSLVKHNVTHSEERKFVCSECPKTFKSMGHMMTHSDIKPFKCDKCDKSYCDGRSLKRHGDQYHLLDTNETSLPSCISQDALQMNASYAGDTISRPEDESYEESLNDSSSRGSSLVHLCGICGRTFRTMQALNGHMRFHVGSTKDEHSQEYCASNQDTKCSLNYTFVSNTPRSQNVLNELPQIDENSVFLADSKTSVVEVHHDTNVGNQIATFSPIYLAGDINTNLKASFCPTTSNLSLPGMELNSSHLSSVDLRSSMCTSENDILLINNSPRSTFMNSKEDEQQSYSMQLQHLAHYVHPAMFVQLQGHRLSKILNIQPTDTHMARSSVSNDLANTVEQRPHNSYSLLHSLLMPKIEEQTFLQTSQPQNESVMQTHPTGHLVDTCVKENVLAVNTEDSLNQEMLGNFSEDVNFEGLALDTEGIEILLGHQIRASHELKEDQVNIEDAAAESSIPEDLRNIPTHTLQMFSLSSRSGTPPPLLDRLGNEVVHDIKEDNLLNQTQAIVSEYGQHHSLDIRETVMNYSGPLEQCSLNTWNKTLKNELIKNLLDISKSNCYPETSDSIEQILPKNEILGERFYASSENEHEKVINDYITSASSSSCRSIKFPPSPKKIQKTEKFRNPGLLKMKRRHWPGPLIIPSSSTNASQLPCSSGCKESSSSGSSNFAFQSRLRSPRVIPGSGSFDSSVPPPFNLPFVPYTPPPMLSPVRNSSGLFCLIQAVLATQTPPGHKAKKIGTSPDLFEGLVEEVVTEKSSTDKPPATDIEPHINEGHEYQADIPGLDSNPISAFEVDDHAQMVWNPSVVQNIPENELRAYLDFSSCAATPFNGCNKELAHHVLYLYGGEVKRACLAIMESNPLLPYNQFIDSYTYSETATWNSEEIDKFSTSLLKYSKDFLIVSKEVGSKSCKECIEFYYLWKKVCYFESIKLKAIRRKHDNTIYNNLRSKTSQQLFDISTCSEEQELYPREHIPTFNDQVSPSNEIQSFPFPLISTSPGSLHYQKRLPLKVSTSAPKKQGRPSRVSGGKSAKNKNTPPIVPNPDTIFPCKICKKVFYKVKSRSAHMKTHRMQSNAKKPSITCDFVSSDHNNEMDRNLVTNS